MTTCRTLIVDDSEGWREQLHELLQAAGCQVITAPDRATALRALEAGSFDLAIVDVNLDDTPHNVDGLRLSRDLLARNAHTRVILISARSLTAQQLASIAPAVFIEKSSIINDETVLLAQAQLAARRTAE